MNKVPKLLLIGLFTFIFLFLFGPTKLLAQFDDDPYEGCGTINPNRMAPAEELCMAYGGNDFIYPHIFCATNANVCCPAGNVPAACRENVDDEEDEEDIVDEEPVDTGYEESNQNCGSFFYDAGISQNVCLDGDRKIIVGAASCSGRSTLCCRADSCPACWTPSVERFSCQPCTDGSTETYDDEQECIDALPVEQSSGGGGGGSDYSICSSNLGNNQTALRACQTCMGQNGIWTSVGCISQDPKNLVAKIVNIGIGILGGIFLLRVLAAAFTLTVSQGDVKKTSEAKEMITESVIGVSFVLFSVTILQFIGSGVLKIPGFGG